MLEFPFKDEHEILDYTVDWAGRLGSGGDTIATSTWFFDPDAANDDELKIDSNNHDPTTSALWLSGGTTGATYILTNRVTTAGGRTMDQSVKIRIKTK